MSLSVSVWWWSSASILHCGGGVYIFMLLLSTELQGFPRQKQFHDVWWRNNAVSFQLYSVSSPIEKLPDALECPCSDEVLSIQTYMNFFPRYIPGVRVVLSKQFLCHPGRWISWLEHCPIHQKIAGSIPSHGTYRRQSINVSLTLMLLSPWVRIKTKMVPVSITLGMNQDFLPPKLSHWWEEGSPGQDIYASKWVAFPAPHCSSPQFGLLKVILIHQTHFNICES